MRSTCKNCEGTIFEVVEQSPTNANYKMFFVQCSTCGQPIGALEYYAGWVKMNSIEEKVKKLELKIDNLEYLLRILINNQRSR